MNSKTQSIQESPANIVFILLPKAKHWGKELDVHGTPTLIVNGSKLGHPQTAQDFDRMVKAGKSLVDPKT
jgi:hypothetical protein